MKQGSLRAVELFAGVGGFRVALQRTGWHTVWANQWEPATRAQQAFDCYVRNFLPGGERDPLNEVRTADSVAVNEDISLVLEQIEAGVRPPIPDHDLLVGGFPCQDYSVAKSLNQARGIEGKKGVLWWSIYGLLEVLAEENRAPRFLFLENVDRLLKSPASQRGRDFAIILVCLAELGYRVEWRVANAADYGYPQRRRRVFIIAERTGRVFSNGSAGRWITRDGILARALPVRDDSEDSVIPLKDLAVEKFELTDHPAKISEYFGNGRRVSQFANAGVMAGRQVWTRRVEPAPLAEPGMTLEGVLLPDDEVPEEFFIPQDRMPVWAKLKGAKTEQRRSKQGHEYTYAEGAIAFPDPRDRPSRTILTGEGGTAPSRFKHVVAADDGRLRRLTPVELERLNGFDDDWTTGMSDAKRAFMMGNALVVGMVERVAGELAEAQLGRRTSAKTSAS